MIDESVARLTARNDLAAENAALRAEIDALRAQLLHLDRLAHDDTLVPLANRRGLLRELERAIARADRHDTAATLLFVDLDGLKAINDGFGHGAGDAALVHVATCLRQDARTNDFIARIGGDEFCVVLEHCAEALAHEIAGRMADRIAATPFRVDGVDVPLSISFGVGRIQRGDTPERLLARADRAMYRSKSA